MADIATGDGNRIDEWVLERNGRGQIGRIRKLNWPEQGRPSKIDWKVWIKVLFISICKGGQNLIWEKLGRWFEQKVARAIPNWQWYWNSNDEALCE